MNYNEAIEYLNNLSKAGIKPGLQAVGALCDALGNPEKLTGVIHIAGTNGKGSTGSFIASVLKEAGYRVGVYSSPAVFEDREIIKVNGNNISKKDYVNLIEEIENTGLDFTRFELETVMAFMYFRNKNCDYAVIECGMGGALDATNIIKDKVLTVFPSIGMDHMQYLGDTIEEIAANKAGIITCGSTSVIGPGVGAEACEVIEKAACEAGGKFVKVYKEAIKNPRFSLHKTTFDYKEYKKLEIELIGEYQPENAVTAIEAICELKKRGIKISDKALINGLHNAKEPGRFEVILNKPCFVIDGAHNEPASLKLRNSIEKFFADKKIIFIIGVLKDKEYVKVLKNTVDLAWQVITVTSPNKARALPAYDLALEVSKINPQVTAADSIEEAVELSLMLADKDTVIVSYGSLSYLSVVKETVFNRKDIKKDWHGTHD